MSRECAVARQQPRLGEDQARSRPHDDALADAYADPRWRYEAGLDFDSAGIAWLHEDRKREQGRRARSRNRPDVSKVVAERRVRGELDANPALVLIDVQHLERRQRHASRHRLAGEMGSQLVSAKDAASRTGDPLPVDMQVSTGQQPLIGPRAPPSGTVGPYDQGMRIEFTMSGAPSTFGVCCGRRRCAAVRRVVGTRRSGRRRRLLVVGSGEGVGTLSGIPTAVASLVLPFARRVYVENVTVPASWTKSRTFMVIDDGLESTSSPYLGDVGLVSRPTGGAAAGGIRVLAGWAGPCSICRGNR